MSPNSLKNKKVNKTRSYMYRRIDYICRYFFYNFFRVFIIVTFQFPVSYGEFFQLWFVIPHQIRHFSYLKTFNSTFYCHFDHILPYSTFFIFYKTTKILYYCCIETCKYLLYNISMKKMSTIYCIERRGRT